MKNKIITLIIIFFGFFFFSCFNVNASSNSEYISLQNTGDVKLHYLNYNNRTYDSGFYFFGPVASDNVVDYFDFTIRVNNNTFLANHEYILTIQLGSSDDVCYNENTCYTAYPFLASVANNYKFDTNVIFSSKSFSFYYHDSNNSLQSISRENLYDSTFSMGYDDSVGNAVYYINFSFVPPRDIEYFTMRLYTNYSILYSDTNKSIWKVIDTSRYNNPCFNIKSFVYDPGEFQGYEHYNLCIGDQCTYSSYINYSSQIDSDIQNGGFNLKTFISSAFERIGSFVSASYYLFGMCSAMFTALPVEIRSVLIFTFTLGCIIILWKVIRD